MSKNKLSTSADNADQSIKEEYSCVFQMDEELQNSPFCQPSENSDSESDEEHRKNFFGRYKKKKREKINTHQESSNLVFEKEENPHSQVNKKSLLGDLLKMNATDQPTSDIKQFSKPNTQKNLSSYDPQNALDNISASSQTQLNSSDEDGLSPSPFLLSEDFVENNQKDHFNDNYLNNTTLINQDLGQDYSLHQPTAPNTLIGKSDATPGCLEELDFCVLS